MKDHIDINVDDDPNVYYLERSDIPGVCVESGDFILDTYQDLKESSESSR